MSYSSWVATLAAGSILIASLPASAQVVRFDRALTQGASPQVTDVQFRGGGFRRYHGGGGFHGGGFRGRGYGYRGGFRGGRGAAIGAGVAGLAAGALIGGALASQGNAGYGYNGGYGVYGGQGYPGYAADPGYVADPGYAYAAPPVQTGDASGYCAQRYKSYDPNSGTYLGYDGARHPCP